LQRTRYNALSVAKKTPELPLPLGIFSHPTGGRPSHGHGQQAQKNW